MKEIATVMSARIYCHPLDSGQRHNEFKREYSGSSCDYHSLCANSWWVRTYAEKNLVNEK